MVTNGRWDWWNEGKNVNAERRKEWCPLTEDEKAKVIVVQSGRRKKRKTTNAPSENEARIQKQYTYETVLDSLSEMYSFHANRIPSLSEIEKYRKTHDNVPSSTTFSIYLGPKNTWYQQLDEYLKNKTREEQHKNA